MKPLRILGWTLAAAVAPPLLGWLALPWPVAYRWVDPHRTGVMRYRLEQAAREGDTLVIDQRWVPLDRISKNMVRAVMASEDGRFERHHGIDWEALGEELRYRGKPPFEWTDAEDRAALLAALRFYVEHRDQVKGRSTITQQVAKNLYFSPERSVARKAAEFFVARRLERFLSKDRIMEIYLNTVELGPGVFGVEAAAQKYFETSAEKLTQFQAASLAGTLPQPLISNPGYRPSRMAWRRDRILARLRGGGEDLSPIPDEPALPSLDVPAVVPDGTDAVPDAAPPEAGDVAPPTEEAPVEAAPPEPADSI